MPPQPPPHCGPKSLPIKKKPPTTKKHPRPLPSTNNVGPKAYPHRNNHPRPQKTHNHFHLPKLWAQRPTHKEITTHDQKIPTTTSIYHCHGTATTRNLTTTAATTTAITTTNKPGMQPSSTELYDIFLKPVAVFMVFFILRCVLASL